MIEFPCNCGYRFSVPDDLAGSVLQCPQCKRLNDIPTLSDLANLDDGGVYKLDSAPEIRNDDDRVSELTYVFTREHYDANGAPIDIRGAVGEEAGAEPIPVESLGPLDHAAPKYDPVTGELVRELDIKPDPKPAQAHIPTAKRANLPPPSVVNGMDVPQPLEVFSIPLRLLRPINLMVMGFILLAHFIGAMLTMFMSTAMALLVIPIWVFWHALIIAHYGNVIDETGPTSRGELPTPLRHLGFYEDIWAPLSQLLFTLMFCYVPGVAVLMNVGSIPKQVLYGLSAALLLAGTVFLPAVMLTMTTSGTAINARPDRLWGVMLRCGAEYFLSVILWIFAAATTFLGVASISGAAVASTKWNYTDDPILQRWYVAWSLMAVGIYLMHLFCWHLGTLYRKHYASFPWALQRHEKQKQALGFAVQPARRPRPVPNPQSGAAPQRVLPVAPPPSRRG
jgi:hypothetical protein